MLGAILRKFLNEEKLEKLDQKRIIAFMLQSIAQKKLLKRIYTVKS